jgi:hypothetical protein
MVVLIVDKDCVLFVECERQTLVAAHFDRPMALEIAGQLVKSPTRHIHIRCRLCIIKQLKPVGELFGVGRWDAGLASKA